MRAVVIRDFGDADVLALESRPDPVPGNEELLVRVDASGINRADLLQRQGKYPPPPGASQDIPGLEFAGVVEAVGPDVTTWKVGERAMGIVTGGGYAELVLVHERAAVPVPSGVDPVPAGAIPEVFMTAFDAVVLQAGLEPGGVLLIHAVGSGVGTAALQLAARMGVRTLGTSRTQAKLERAMSMGLDVAIDAADDWSAAVLDHTDGRGVDVILDLVGGPYLQGNQKVIGARGRHVVVGVPGGQVAEVNLRALMA
ncbi:MAG: zinc-binding dehydrogenase, partial [Longimicrobiales bacterium]